MTSPAPIELGDEDPLYHELMRDGDWFDGRDNPMLGGTIVKARCEDGAWSAMVATPGALPRAR
jgi:hypothetical protein